MARRLITVLTDRVPSLDSTHLDRAQFVFSSVGTSPAVEHLYVQEELVAEQQRPVATSHESFPAPQVRTIDTAYTLLVLSIPVPGYYECEYRTVRSRT